MLPRALPFPFPRGEPFNREKGNIGTGEHQWTSP
nr:MAG TPA: hypothetical protein [Caudoviricetes sp.]